MASAGERTRFWARPRKTPAVGTPRARGERLEHVFSDALLQTKSTSLKFLVHAAEKDRTAASFLTITAHLKAQHRLVALAQDKNRSTTVAEDTRHHVERVNTASAVAARTIATSQHRAARTAGRWPLYCSNFRHRWAGLPYFQGLITTGPCSKSPVRSPALASARCTCLHQPNPQPSSGS